MARSDEASTARVKLRWWRGALTALAVTMLLAAAWIAASQVDWQVLRQAQAWQWMALAGAVVMNLLLAGAMFWAVTLPFDAKPRVGLGAMTTLVTVSALLNFLPLRPGLMGRAAWLKARHGLPVGQSVVILLIVLIVGGGVTVAMGLLAWLIHDPWVLMWALVAVMAAMTALTAPMARWVLRRPMGGAVWLWVPLRVTDTLVTAARLWVAFGVIGLPLTFREALILGAAGLVAAMVGLTPNGLGLKEWLVAILAQGLAVSAWQEGLAATLVDRGVEALVVVVLGAGAMALLWRSWPGGTAAKSQNGA